MEKNLALLEEKAERNLLALSEEREKLQREAHRKKRRLLQLRKERDLCHALDRQVGRRGISSALSPREPMAGGAAQMSSVGSPGAEHLLCMQKVPVSTPGSLPRRLPGKEGHPEAQGPRVSPKSLGEGERGEQLLGRGGPGGSPCWPKATEEMSPGAPFRPA